MISYRPFYKTLLARGMTEYQLIYKLGFSANTIHRIKHGKPITTRTLNSFCVVLDCDIDDIIEYVRDDV